MGSAAVGMGGTIPTEDKKSVWVMEKGEVRKPGLAHFVMMALFSGVGVVVGAFGSMAVSLGPVSAFWPGQAIQSVGTIWYGGWGALAGSLFPLIANSIAGSAALPISIAYIPGNFAQSVIGALAFRKFDCDPRLRSAKDWVVFLVFGVFLANAVGAFEGVCVLYLLSLIHI